MRAALRSARSPHHAPVRASLGLRRCCVPLPHAPSRTLGRGVSGGCAWAHAENASGMRDIIEAGDSRLVWYRIVCPAGMYQYALNHGMRASMHTCCSRSCMSSLKDFWSIATVPSSRELRLEPTSTRACRWEFSLLSDCSASCAAASCSVIVDCLWLPPINPLVYKQPGCLAVSPLVGVSHAQPIGALRLLHYVLQGAGNVV